MYMHSTNKSVQYVQGAHTLATERTFITLRRGNDLETHYDRRGKLSKQAGTIGID